jgi:hypothetical protein
MQAIPACEARGADFARVYRYQYVIARAPMDTPGMQAHQFAGMHIRAGSGLPVARIRDRHGLAFGVLLGIGVDPGGLVTQNRRIDMVDLSAEDPFRTIEDWIDNLAGRWTLLAAAGGVRRIYCDPAGTNGVLHNRRLGRVGSSLLLCLDDPVQDRPDYDHRLIETEGAKYTLFDTRDTRVRRMNPSCYLDIASFAETRYWPREDWAASVPPTLPQVYDEIITTASHATQTMIRSFPCALPLSGGRDSRLLAGFAGRAIHQVAQVYTHVNNYGTRQDAAIGALVAAALGVPHEIHDHREWRPDTETRGRLRDEFQIGLGYDAEPPGELRNGVAMQLADGALVLRGHQTDILRAVLLDKPGAAGRADLRWQVKRLMPVPMAKFTGEVYRRFRARYGRWLRALPETLREKSIDLMFLEIYYSSSIGAIFPALNRNFYISPFNSRRMVLLAMSIDDDYRKTSLAVDDLLYRLNPALHHVPLDYETGPSLDDLADPAYRRAAVRVRMARTAQRAAQVGGIAVVGEPRSLA